MRYHSVLLVLITFLFMTAACNGGGDKTPTAPTYPVGKPTGVNAAAGNQSATISWNTTPGAVGYYVYVSYDDGSSFHKYSGGIIQATQFTVLNLTNGSIYYFGVSAVGSGGWESSISYPDGAPRAKPIVPDKAALPPDPNAGPPSPPRNLQGIAKDSACEIEWEASISPDVSFYRIYRAVGGASNFSLWPILVDNYTDFEYRDEDLVNDSTYSYRITAVDTEFPPFESSASNAVTLSPMDFAPEILTGLDAWVNPGRVILEWDEPIEPDITRYAIERVEGVDELTGAEIITRFLISKPTQTIEEPHEYIEGLVLVWVDLERNVVVVQDMAVLVGVVYKYRIAAIDGSDQEGPPASVTAPTPVF